MPVRRRSAPQYPRLRHRRRILDRVLIHAKPPPEQPTVVTVLCAFVRDHASVPLLRSGISAPASPKTSVPIQPPTDIQAALTVIGTRNPAYDGSTTAVNLSGVDVPAGAILSDGHFANANFFGANLYGANLSGADFSGADVSFVNLAVALTGGSAPYSVNFFGADLSGTDLILAQLDYANFTGAELEGTEINCADFYAAHFHGADLSDANAASSSYSDPGRGFLLGRPF